MSILSVGLLCIGLILLGVNAFAIFARGRDQLGHVQVRPPVQPREPPSAPNRRRAEPLPLPDMPTGLQSGVEPKEPRQAQSLDGLTPDQLRTLLTAKRETKRLAMQRYRSRLKAKK